MENNLNTIKTIKSTKTIVAPVGVADKYDIVIPRTNAIKEIIMLDIKTVLNFLNICIDDKVGNMIKLDINKDPISLIPITTTKEHKLAKIML